MLRITVYEDARCLTVQLEGRLAGRWVQELDECWQRIAASQQKPIVRVDLTEVTFIDAEGQACLMRMHDHGAEFVAADCLTKAVVDEITQGPTADARGAKVTSDRRAQTDNVT